MCHEEWVSVRSRLGLKGDESSTPVGFDPRSKGLAWAPPGLPAHKVSHFIIIKLLFQSQPEFNPSATRTLLNDLVKQN